MFNYILNINIFYGKIYVNNYKYYISMCDSVN